MSVLDIVKGWIATRTGFTKPQLDSMDALDNQPLRAEWIAYCEVWAAYRARGGKDNPFKAFILWHYAVLAAYGPEVQIELSPEGCRLSTGDFYPYPKE